jgi:inhibitor of KinA sporulation pathway (predicted exonuclease)
MGISMKRRLDQILVVDVEATCWDGPPPAGQESEIIEIGLCLLAVDSGQRLMRESLLVCPERSKVSEYCSRLTTLTQEQVELGMPFEQACRHLRDVHHARQRTMASYGDYDRLQFERQCRARSLPYPFGRTHLNVKNLLAIALGLPREVGLDRGLSMLGLPLEGTHHRGDDDAWNIATILSYLLKRMRKI